MTEFVLIDEIPLTVSAPAGLPDDTARAIAGARAGRRHQPAPPRRVRFCGAGGFRAVV